MRALFFVALVACLAATSAHNLGSPNCNTFSDCSSCASAKTWTGSHCRWCPKDGNCHAEGSMYNQCSSSQNIVDPSKCAATPPPAPPPPAPTPTPFAEKVLAELFKLLKITDVDPSTCVNDVGRADTLFKDFAQDVSGGNVSSAVMDLSRGLSALSSSVSGCGVPEIQTKIDMLAASIRWANISTAGFDKDVKVIVDAANMWDDIAALGKAVADKDTTAVGAAIGKLLTDWTAITGGCGDNTACKVLDGVLKVVQVVATEVAPCEAALEPAIANLTQAASLFKQKQYKEAVALFAAGLDGISKAITMDSCGLGNVGKVISEVVPKLAGAIVKVENSTAVQIIVGSADIYDDLYQATMDLENGDMTDFGMEMGKLLSKLRASSCTTKACTVLEGLLESLQLEASDYAACSKDIDASWTDMSKAITDFEGKKWSDGLKDLAGVLTNLAQATSGCDIPKLAQILEDTATKLGAGAVATVIGEVEQVLVQGSDVTLDIQTLMQDIKNDQWSAVGHDLGTLATWLQGTGCKSFVCKVVEGLLNAAAIPFQDLQDCEKDLQTTESSFTAGAAALAQHQYKAAVTYWATGLDGVALAVQQCGMAAELKFIEQEAATLGFGNVTALGNIATILVHGSDVYDEIFKAFQAFSAHDYRTAGSEIGTVMNQLSSWTTGHSCTSDFCYVVSGMMQYLGDIQGDIKACKADFANGFHNFTAAFRDLTGKDLNGTAATSFPFTKDKSRIKAGIGELGYGLKDVAAGVSDCHLQEFADILEKLAEKLGLAPEIQLVEEVIKIIIEGVQIETEVGDACLDYSQGNWVGFGYNLIKLVKTLI